MTASISTCLFVLLIWATFPKSTYAMRPSGRAKRFPGWGSPWKRPNSSSCRRPETTPTRMNSSTSTSRLIVSTSVQRMPSIHSIVSIRGPEYAFFTHGILTNRSPSKFFPKSSMFCASCR